jgi:hypothetical protein
VSEQESAGSDVRASDAERRLTTDEFILGGRDISLDSAFAPNVPVLRIRSFSIIGGVNVRESREKPSRDASS